MSVSWYFTTAGDVVHLQARMEGDGDTVGHAYRAVEPGDEFYGLSYAELAKSRAGMVRVSATGKATIARDV